MRRLTSVSRAVVVTLALAALLAALNSCGSGTVRLGATPTATGPTVLADTGPALYGVGIACGGAPVATATCAAETGAPVVCRQGEGNPVCQPAVSIFAIGKQSGLVRWRHAERSVPSSSEVTLLPAGDRLYVFVGTPDGPDPGPGDLTARRASDGTAIWRRHLPTFATQLFLAGDTLLVFSFTPRDGTNQLTILRTSDGSVVSSTLLQLNGRLLVRDGVIYGCGQDHSITALRASTGTQLWNTSPGWDNQLYMLDLCFFTYADGVLYVQRELSDTLYALRASDGKVLWSETRPYQTLLAAGAGLALVSGAQGQLQVEALRASDGRLLWRVPGVAPCCKGETPASFITGGMVFLGLTGEVEGLRASDGQLLWRRQMAEHSLALCDVTADRVFVLSYLPPGSRLGPEPFKGDSVLALSAATGQTVWTTQASSDALTLSADG
jgi:outer membrane protein assembly factor BamB